MQNHTSYLLKMMLIEHLNNGRSNFLLINSQDQEVISSFVKGSQKITRNRLNEITEVENSYLFVTDPNAFHYPTVKNLYKAILNQFLYAYDYTDNIFTLKKKIHYLIKKFHTKILIIDHFQKLLEGSDSKTHRIIFALNQLATELDLSIIAIGNEEMARLLKSNETYADKFKILVLHS